MEMLLDLAMTFWQWTVLGVLVIIGYVVNKFDKEEEDLIQFKYPDMPKMQPVPIATKDKGFFRSEERRVGKECLRLCRSRWSPYH